MRWRGRVEGKIFACFGGKYLLWCGVNAAGEVAANVQGESLKAAAVIHDDDFCTLRRLI